MAKQAFAIVALLILTTEFAQAEEARSVEPPFERTENRPPCAHYSATRQPFFGQLHLHTQYSADAATLQTRLTPRDAYRFARGEKVGLAPFFDTRKVKTDDSEPAVGGVSAHPYCLPPESCRFTAMRTIQLPAGRELDFAAVTDHSEYLGETNICFFESDRSCRLDRDCMEGESCNRGACVPNGYDSDTCSQARGALTALVPSAAAARLIAGWLMEQPVRPRFCDDDGDDGDDTCVFQAKNVWQQIIVAAKEAYDPGPQCRFTSFVGYEYTSMPAMNQCTESFAPCFDDADCGDGDSCSAPGQCSEPAGEPCFADDDCAAGATCVANGGGYNLHRNVIFRNANVPELPVTYFDAITGCGAGQRCKRYEGPLGNYPRGAFSTDAGIALGSPTVFLQAVREKCNPEQEKPCDFLSIPHNSNLSGGAMFILPESPEDARVRGEHERLVEIFQIKGGSECRYSRRHPDAWQPGAYAPDELCDFENMSFAALTGAFLIDPDDRSVPASGYVRNALKDGLRYQQQHREEGVNPFQLGFVGSLDNHNGTPTATEVDYSKFGAHGTNSFAADGQMMNETFFLGLETNGGGVAVVWAEENSRDSLFAAMKRRETYATSGTRPVVRFFGGFDLPPGMCDEGDFAATGYNRGVPMGGTLGPGEGAPRFAVHALMDPGWEGHPGTTLERAQIVKGWVDEDGEVHERVYDVAGGPAHRVDVDLATCRSEKKPNGLGQLCTVWSDPHFDPGQHAFYYARVLENPSCRWNQLYCLDRGVDCAEPSRVGKDVVGYNAYDYQQCCGDDVPKAVQQRAWTSPIWYVP